MAAITINGIGYTIAMPVDETIGLLRQAVTRGEAIELPLRHDEVIFVNPSAGVVWVGEEAGPPTIL